MNIRLAKAISTYSKLEHKLTASDCIKVMHELEELTQFLEMAELAKEEAEEYQRRLVEQEINERNLRIVSPKDRVTAETEEENL